MAENENYDPLGVKNLTNEIKLLKLELDKLKEFISSGLDIPVCEDRIMEITGAKKRTLLRLRNEGKLSFTKVGKDVMYLPSVYRKEIMKIGA